MVATLVILTILLLVAVDGAVQWYRQRQSPALPAPPAPLRADLPAGLFLHPGHGWVQVNTDGTAQVGVDAFVRQAVGAPDRITARAAGTWIRQGEPMVEVGKGGRRLSVAAPLSGRIEAVNPDLARHPAWWPEAADRGWTYTVRPSHLGSEVACLRLGERATAWLREQTASLASWLAESSTGPLAVTLPDGGAPARGALGRLGGEAWSDFERCFLRGSSPADDARPAGSSCPIA